MKPSCPCAATLALLETRVSELERRAERSCERCRVLALLDRCARCERDLCQQCMGEKACAHDFDKRHEVRR